MSGLGAVLAALALAAQAEVAPAGAPAPAEVEIVVAASALVLGVDQEAELRVVASGAGPLEEPRLHASAGRVEDLVRVGPREFLGRYVLPAERFPQAAIVVAEFEADGRPLRGFVVLRLRAAATPAFRTDPDAEVTIRIGDKEFGPQRAQRDGTVRIPVVVPPGVAFGTARSVNRFGQATEQTVDLRLPPFRQVLVVAPETLPAGAVAEVAAYAVDGAGLPVDGRQILLRGSGPGPQPLGGRPGEARFLLRAPTRAPHTLRLEASLRDQPGTAVVHDLALVAGTPRQLRVQPDRPRLPIGRGSAMRVYLSAEDGFGNAADPVGAAVLVDGVPVETRAGEDGRLVAIVPAPPAYDGRDRVAVEAAVGAAYAREEIPLMNLPAPAPPARPRRAPPETPRLTVTPRLGVLWTPAQPPAPAVTVEVLGRPRAWPAWILAGVAGGALAGEHLVEDGGGLSRVTLRQVPVLALARLRHRAAPRLVLAAAAGGGVTVAHATVHSFGHAVSGRALVPAALVDAEAAVTAGPGQAVLGARYLHAHVGRLSSGDRLRGNAAGLVADVGYRLAW